VEVFFDLHVDGQADGKSVCMVCEQLLVGVGAFWTLKVRCKLEAALVISESNVEVAAGGWMVVSV
jgi:hypothetical protein